MCCVFGAGAGADGAGAGIGAALVDPRFLLLPPGDDPDAFRFLPELFATR